MARAAEEGRRRAKAKPGSLVINPDGYTYSYAIKIEAVSQGSTSNHSRSGSHALDAAESRGQAAAAAGSFDAAGTAHGDAENGDARDSSAADAQGEQLTEPKGI